MKLLANSSYEVRFVFALFVTVVVETFVIVCLIKFFYKITSQQLPMHRCLFSGFFASFATLPYLWFVLPAFIHPYFLLVTIGEAGVYFLEALAYVFLLNLPFKKTVVLSVVANSASIIIGLLVLAPF